MCGRFTLRTPLSKLMERFRVESTPSDQLELFGPRYNIAPTQQVLAVRKQETVERELVTLRWGLIPSWSRNPKKGPPLINARAETVAEKPSFRSAWKCRRCLLLADGFYEWQAATTGKSQGKQPYFIGYSDEAPFAFAGLWERWSPSDGSGVPIESCTIVTTEAVGWMADIHHRMPVILSMAECEVWLGNGDDAEPGSTHRHRLVEPREYPELEHVPVSPYVNKVQHDDPACLTREARLF